MRGGFWRVPRQLRRLRLGLQTRRGSNHSAAHGSESNSRSNVFQICRTSVCVSSRWKVLSGEFRRRPTALVIKFRKLDRVGRRGLSEPGGIFSRLLTYAFPWLHPWIQPQHPHHIQLETSPRIFSRLNQIIIKTAPAIAHRNPKPMLNKPISCVADWDIAGVEAPLFSTAAI